MSRPDPRLLVPVSVLSVVPAGSCVWRGDDAFTVLGGPWPDGTLSMASARWRGESHTLHGVAPAGPGITPQSRVPAVDIMLDASAPALRDGLPVRLDALPWLLKVLHPRATQIEGHAHAQYPGVLLLSIENGVMVHWRDYTKHRGTWSGTFVLDPWPDLLGLSDDEAARAVVVAAIVARPRP